LPSAQKYRGRIAPSPTGYLHLGHARTFWIAQKRARAAGGTLVFRNEDLDVQRCRPKFVTSMYDDLRWLGLEWQEGPDVGGPLGPYSQSERREFYLEAWRELRDSGAIYPCTCSRKDLEQAISAPHDDADEIPYPGTCRTKAWAAKDHQSSAGVSWRFRVPAERKIQFNDALQGEHTFLAGQDFSDFLVWRRDDIPAYQLACAVDDNAMRITEVVRGCDLLKSTARQILLYEALGFTIPQWAHCELMTDSAGVRLAKRHDALSLHALRDKGMSAAEVIESFTKMNRSPIL
jgi:glutamyl/glutaminyl-tRNA synthetase